VAAAIRDSAGRSVAAFSVSAPVSVLRDEMILQVSDIIREAAMRVSSQLGFRGGSNFQSLL
jgi:DNA-binding IclR family transcriptional regulator